MGAMVPALAAAARATLSRSGVAIALSTGSRRRLLDAGMDPVGFVDRRRRGPLHHLATVDGGANLLDRLLSAGLHINGTDADGHTPLIRALIARAAPALVRAMLAAGADPYAAVDLDGHPRVPELGTVRREVLALVVEAARSRPSG
jgi:ankyrin repeat protein